jgi:two-component system sensor histidine kinase CpxA
MRSLFLKVFLWFWLAMALVIGAFLLVNELSRNRQRFPHDALTDRYTAFIAQTAAGTYERDGQMGLVHYLAHVEHVTGLRGRLFDEQGAELSGLPALTGAQEIARRVAETHAPVFHPPSDRFLLAFPATTASGRAYVFVGEFSAPFPPPPLNPWVLIPRILAMLLTAGLLCYLLARYIVSPVVKLRAVTQQVAGGDLSARVGPLLGTRRDELAAMGHDFDAMAARIETLVSAQARLIRDISHELRSPLARLVVALDLARKRAGTDATSALDRIEREARRLNEMIGQLLTLARWESDMDGRRREPVELAALVREVVADAEFEAGNTNRSVAVAACEPCRVTGAAPLLRSAIENVVRNAVHYTAAHTTVDVSLRCRHEADESTAIINVRDHGAGVPEESLTDIFRPFYRVADARDRESGGTGLGLAITERAVRLHGGQITAANHATGGLVVEIRLPAMNGSEQHVEQRQPESVSSMV